MQIYMKNLETLVNVFVNPLQELVFTPQQILSSNEISTIFSNVQLILNVNKQLLQVLGTLRHFIALLIKYTEERMKNWSRTTLIGDLFLRIAPFFKLYIQYVNNMNTSIATTNSCRQNNPLFKAFLDQTLENEEVRKMGLKGLENFQVLLLSSLNQ